MSRLKWDETGTRFYETGVDRGVVYPYDSTDKVYNNGVEWNGLTGFTDSPSGGDETVLWADNMKYGAMRAAEEYGGTITAYTYPDTFALLDGSAEPATGVFIGQQSRGTFGFSCRTLVGNDTKLNDAGYKLHLIYGASVSPSDKDYSTVNDSPDAIEFSWEFTTTPVNVGTAYKSTAHLTIDTTKLNEAGLASLANLENVLYGLDTGDVYTKLMSTTAPADWPTTSDASTKYFKNTASAGQAPNYVGVTVSDTYSANTYFKKQEAGPRLPSPREVIEDFFGGTVDATA